jgi:hypothetical protein
MDITIDITTSGAVFDGRAEAAAHDYVNHVLHTVADETESRVKHHLDGVLRVNHGVYVSWTHQEQSGDEIAVTDRYIVYGPWLEGVGSRVGPPGSGKWPYTRFEGYHTYRIVGQEMEIAAPDIALRELPPYLAIMNS